MSYLNDYSFNYLSFLFSFLVEAVILWQYSSSLFTAKCKMHIRLTLLCSLYTLLFAASLFQSVWLNIVLYFCANFIFFATQYKVKWQSALFHSTILMAVMGMCELIGYGVFSRFTPNFLQIGTLYSLILFAVFNKFIFFTIIYVLSHLLKKHPKYNQQSDKSVLLLMFIPITSVFVMVTFVFIGEAVSLSPALDWMVVLSAVLLLAANLLIFGINQHNQKKSMEFTQLQLLLQKESDSAEYYEMLRLQNENQRILIHDIKKHLQSIAMLNEQEENHKVSAYIQQLILSSDLKESSRLCDNDLLNSILCRYQRQCADSHIAFHTDIRKGTTDFIADNDITSLFCNLLDNAVEATQNVPDSFIEVNTSKRDKTPFTMITVINSCRTNPFSKQDGSLMTNKPDQLKHGFGLKSIRKTVKKYNGDIQMYFNDETMTFHTIIALKQY